MPDSIVLDANCFVSRWFIRPEERDEFIRQFDALWQADISGLRAATNFVFYGWGRDPNEFVAIESWRDEQSVIALRKSEYFQKAVGDLMALCSRDVEMMIFAGKDVPGSWLFNEYPAGTSAVHPRRGDIGAVFT